MGIFSRLFGRKEENEVPQTKSSVQPSILPKAQKETKREYETPIRNFIHLPEDVDIKDYKLAGVARIDILLLMGRMTGDKKAYEYINVMYEALSDEGVIPVHLVVEKNQKRYGVFAFYSEAEARNFKKFREVLKEKCCFEDVYYVSACDPEKYSEENGSIEKDTAFHAIFRKEDSPKEEDFEGRYALWWSTLEDPIFINSITAKYYQEINTAIDKYGSYFCGMALCAMSKKEFERILLPDEEQSIYVMGPDNQKCIMVLSQEKGFRFLLPRDAVDTTYRNNILKLISKSIVFLRKGLEEREVPLDPEGRLSSKEWMDSLISGMESDQSIVQSIAGITIGNPTIPEKKREVDIDKVYIRIKIGDSISDLYVRDSSVEIPDEQQPVMANFQENFILGLVQDMGYSYEFVNNKMMDEFDGDFQELVEVGKTNVLREVNKDIKVVGDAATGPVMITCGGNHEPALVVFDDFWMQIEEMFKSDICMIMPVRDILIVSNFYQQEGMAYLRDRIKKFYYDPEQKGKMSNHIYLRKENKWKSIEVVEP